MNILLFGILLGIHIPAAFISEKYDGGFEPSSILRYGIFCAFIGIPILFIPGRDNANAWSLLAISAIDLVVAIVWWVVWRKKN